MAVDVAPAHRARTAAVAQRTRRSTRRSVAAAHRGDAPLAWLLVAPALLGFLVFAAYPTLRGIYLSFTDFRVLGDAHWIGGANFARMMDDEVFWNSLRVTIYYVLLSAGGVIVLGLVTAVVLHRLTASTTIRSLVIIPFLVSNIVAGVIWTWMLDSQLGIANELFQAVGIPRIQFFTDPQWAVPSLAAVTIWKGLGYTTILLFVGLQALPHQVYEAARLDGASEVQMFFRITIPMLRPVLAMVVILTIINCFQIFDLVQVTTKGGPENSTNVLQNYIYSKAFGQFDFGYASALSLGLFLIMLVITFVQMRISRINESDSEGVA
ncbi:carbohydrate ABC transporter permease [Xylanimonas protaetiae]|uniref:Sugar ABC transporter permease n=1 Tax=Xylanimonas protaetiae TaxID=2509457 RepID=A0A4P6F4Y7_9MICO|nr:sugar ABC transporter permease [Xylanimonas protaetiae]QAY70742.1 sugar ABC transporter permease [Xylanimonas protaetiae]